MYLYYLDLAAEYFGFGSRVGTRVQWHTQRCSNNNNNKNISGENSIRFFFLFFFYFTVTACQNLHGTGFYRFGKTAGAVAAAAASDLSSASAASPAFTFSRRARSPSFTSSSSYNLLRRTTRGIGLSSPVLVRCIRAAHRRSPADPPRLLCYSTHP